MINTQTTEIFMTLIIGKYFSCFRINRYQLDRCLYFPPHNVNTQV